MFPDQQADQQMGGVDPMGPMPFGLLPGMEGVSLADQMPLGFPGGPVRADESDGLDTEDATPSNLAQDDDPGRVGIPGTKLQQYYTDYTNSKLGEITFAKFYEEFYHGDHWNEAERAILRQRGQPPFYWNEIRKKIDSYIGIEQRLRRDPKAYPVTPKHDIDADVATAALRHVDDATNSKLITSQAGRDFFVRGIGVVWCGIKRTRKGEIVHDKRHVPAQTFIYDPRSLEWDFADSKWFGEYCQMDVEDAVELMQKLGRPDQAERVRSLTNYGTDTTAADLHLRNLDHNWWSRERQTVRMIHMYYRFEGIWRCAYFIGNVKLYDAPSIYTTEDGESTQPFLAASCNVHIDGTRYGVVKDLIPIQQVINQRYSKLTHMLATRQILFSQGAVDDPKEARKQASLPDGMIQVNDKGLGDPEKVFKIITQDQEIAGNVQLFQQALQVIQGYGPNSALLGKEDSSQQSGRAILARQNAGMTEMSPVFDRHREFKLRLYRRDWELCRAFWTSEKFIRVLDDERGVKFVALNRQIVDPRTGQVVGVENDIAQLDVDIVLDEGPDVIVMQEELLQVLSQTAAASPGMQKILITLSGVRNKDYLMKMIDEVNAPNPQLTQMQERMAALEAIMKAADIDAKIADADAKRAGAAADMWDKGLDPALVGQQFPMVYRQPTMVEGLMQQIFSQPSMAQQMQGQGQQPMQGNAFAGGGPPQQPQQMLAPPSQPQSLPGQEPQMGQAGGLPMGREFGGMADGR